MFVNSSQQLAEKKLLLLYIFEKLEIPITHSQITDFVLENDLMNYFMFQQFFSELQESGFIIEEHKEQQQFIITDKGRNTLKYFINRLSREQLEKIDHLLSIKKKQLLKRAEVEADYVKLDENDVLVTLKVIERDTPLINISLNVANTKQAKIICQNWKENTQKIYSNLISMLIEEKNIKG
ncbi:DUF4364 family protein [Alkaliphilus crotonatoxidans]